MTNDGGPAYPDAIPGVDGWTDRMSLRDYFAAHAPYTLDDAMRYLANNGESAPTLQRITNILCGLRWHYADTMLEAREEP